jgi:hypothetical protein
LVVEKIRIAPGDFYSMSDTKPEMYQNVYLKNAVSGATPNPVMLNPDATEEDEKHFISFAKLVSETLEALWNVRNLKKASTS